MGNIMGNIINYNIIISHIISYLSLHIYTIIITHAPYSPYFLPHNGLFLPPLFTIFSLFVNIGFPPVDTLRTPILDSPFGVSLPFSHSISDFFVLF